MESILTWHPASDPPNHSVLVLVLDHAGFAVGFKKPYSNLFKNERGEFVHGIIAWAELPDAQTVLSELEGQRGDG